MNNDDKHHSQSQPPGPKNQADVRINYRAVALGAAATAMSGVDAQDPAAFAEQVVVVAARFETYLRYGAAGRNRDSR